MTGEWMTAKQAAAESGRHPRCVNDALRRRLLEGHQARAGCSWRISRESFEDWMRRGCPLDEPSKARLRRAS